MGGAGVLICFLKESENAEAEKYEFIQIFNSPERTTRDITITTVSSSYLANQGKVSPLSYLVQAPYLSSVIFDQQVITSHSRLSFHSLSVIPIQTSKAQLAFPHTVQFLVLVSIILKSTFTNNLPFLL